MTSQQIIALAKSIPEAINLLDDREVTECLTRELCVSLNIRPSSVEPHIDEIKQVALAVRLGAFA
jgi:hypothetical protein